MNEQLYDYEDFSLASWIWAIDTAFITPDDGCGKWILDGIVTDVDCFGAPPITTLNRKRLAVRWWNK